jgi:hypothetical protein
MQTVDPMTGAVLRTISTEFRTLRQPMCAVSKRLMESVFFAERHDKLALARQSCLRNKEQNKPCVVLLEQVC